MASQNTYGVIPSDELQCIWMEAGVVDFKLCDRQLQCEQCPFDAQVREQLRMKGREQTVSKTQLRPETVRKGERDMYTHLERQLFALTQHFVHPSLPADRLYSNNHLWFKQQGPTSFRVGIDHLVLSLFESISSIAFTRAPASIQSNAPCVWIEHEGSTLPLKMPFATTIINTNIKLRDTPRLLKQDPYGKGWILRLTVDAQSFISQSLFSWEDVAGIYQRQADMFKKDCQSALAKKTSHVGTTLLDGGIPIEKVEDILGLSLYFKLLLQRFFLL